MSIFRKQYSNNHCAEHPDTGIVRVIAGKHVRNCVPYALLALIGFCPGPAG
ncbi:MAG TPA: hypothetical protein VIO81_01100 [Methyloversatilis sp.]